MCLEKNDSPLKIVKSDGSIDHLEVKTFDHFNNHYLSLASLLISGLEGLKHKGTLSSVLDLDLPSLSEEQKSNLNLKNLPSCF